ncbi:hypothetical protein B0T14DRAFT_517354 [Immersiella caudata]|uniref:Uncharacterized protein n=1 Tax=Immersiella caudata TaxID=314043 RepID=A0AA39WYH6_9PEZI|nr:hypothetical protein B0T14DRAFT_517354 [Immersiella caudata]
MYIRTVFPLGQITPVVHHHQHHLPHHHYNHSTTQPLKHSNTQTSNSTFSTSHRSKCSSPTSSLPSWPLPPSPLPRLRLPTPPRSQPTRLRRANPTRPRKFASVSKASWAAGSAAKLPSPTTASARLSPSTPARVSVPFKPLSLSSETRSTRNFAARFSTATTRPSPSSGAPTWTPPLPTVTRGPGLWRRLPTSGLSSAIPPSRSAIKWLL